MSEPLFSDLFQSIDDMAREFGVCACKINEYEILVAHYAYESYSGSSWVLMRKDGQLYENEASHCSCYGLEGTWSPDKLEPETLRAYLGKNAKLSQDSYYRYPNEVIKRVQEVLEEEKKP
jgi:hypothetical protein